MEKRMQSERDLFRIKLNLGLLIRGDVADLEALLESVRAFVEHRGNGMRLVFSEVSGDQMFIKKRSGP